MPGRDHGGEAAAFTSLQAGPSYLNLTVQSAEMRWSWWGRTIFYVSDVDALHETALGAGHSRSASRAIPIGASAIFI